MPARRNSLVRAAPALDVILASALRSSSRTGTCSGLPPLRHPKKIHDFGRTSAATSGRTNLVGYAARQFKDVERLESRARRDPDRAASSRSCTYLWVRRLD
jgi:hypothetical protein